MPKKYHIKLLTKADINNITYHGFKKSSVKIPKQDKARTKDLSCSIPFKTKA